MNSFSQKTLLKSYKRRIQKKIDEIVEDADNACATIQGITFKLREKADDLLNQDDDTFCSEYQKLYKDIESLSEKLFLSINAFAEEEVPSQESENDDSNHNLQKDTISSKASSKSANNDLPVESPFADSGIIFKCQSNTTEELTDNSREYASPESSQSLNVYQTTTRPKSVYTSSSEDVKPSNSPFVPSESISLEVQSCESDLKDQLLSENDHLESHESFQGSSRRTYSVASSLSAASCDQPTSVKQVVDPNPLFPHNTQLESYNDCAPKSHESLHCLSKQILTPASFLSAMSCDQSTSVKQDVDLQPLFIPDQLVPAGTVITAAITHFVSPSDFWIQLDNTTVEDYLSSNKLCSLDVSSVSKVKYCVVDCKQDGYRRAEVLSVIKKDCDIQVEVFFVDYGGTAIVLAADLMVLPDALCQYPAQAIHCFLYGVAPVGDEWSPEVLEEFDKAGYSDLRAVVLQQEYKQHAVQILMTVHMPPDVVETLDLAQMLCLQQLAKTSSSKSLNATTSETEACLPTESSSSHEIYTHSGDRASKIVNTGLDVETHIKPQMLVPELDRTRLNSDSLSLDGDEEDIYLSDEADNMVLMQYAYPKAEDQNVLLELETTTPVGCDDEFNIEVTIPSAQPLMVQDDLLVIIPSVVYSPTYFYANNSTGNSLELDELRDDMTAFYSSLSDSACLDVEHLKEDMYLACPYEDGYWYRVQINIIRCSKDDQNIPSAVVLYVDYGNESVVPVTDMRPLTRRFAKYPAMAILCALAYIMPLKTPDNSTEEMPANSEGKTPTLPHNLKWNREASERFRQITEDERPLTAQISKFTTLKENRVLHEIFLWDTDEEGDKIINDILVEERLAEYSNLRLLPSLLTWKENTKTEPAVPEDQLFSNWDPMAQDYESVENSYGVDVTDPGVATVGYKATDESYICKFYAANGGCYRGDKCPYQHVAPGYGGGTVDQEGVYLHENTFPLPEPGMFCLLQVSCFMNTGHFYVVFPYGTRPPQEIQKNSSFWINYRNEFQQLSIAMRESYEGSPLVENTKIALAYGTIVAAKTKADGMWYRARVIEVEDVFSPVQVFFVDFGMTEWVERQDIREMKPEYLHCPFQAVEAFLANVDPIDSQLGKKWSFKSKSVFQNLVSGKMLLGYVNQQIGSVLFLTLRLTSNGNRTVINELLVGEGLAEISKSNVLKFPVNGLTGFNGNHKNIFVPG